MKLTQHYIITKSLTMKSTTLFIVPLILSQVCTSLLVTAQSWHTKQANSLDIYFGGDVGYRLLDNLDDSASEVVDNRNTFESFSTNYKFGIGYNIGIGRNISIKTGIRYANPSTSVSFVDRIDFSEAGHNYAFNKNREGYDYKTSHHMIGIPLGLKVVLSESTCDPYIEFGVIPSMYHETRISEFDYDGVNTANYTFTENINMFNLFSFFNVGGNFKISKKVSGFTQLTANYQLNNLRTDLLKENLLGLGVEFGTRIHFN